MALMGSVVTGAASTLQDIQANKNISAQASRVIIDTSI
jgi:hypothetical protein